jgi:aminopeptidase N
MQTPRPFSTHRRAVARLGLLALAAAWVFPAAVSAQIPKAEALVSGGALIPEQACYDVQHYDLALTIHPDDERIEGTLTMRAGIVAETRRVALDLYRTLRVEAVERVATDGEAIPQTFERSDDGLRVFVQLDERLEPGASLTLRVRYAGAPRRAVQPPWDGGFSWERTRDGEPWIATSCQGEGADLWWPVKDHPSDEPDSMDMHFTAPADLVCASNGVLRSVEETEVDGEPFKTWHWHVANPINVYCVTLNLGPYVVIEDTYESVDGTKIPIYFWALPKNEKKARRVLPDFLEHLRFFEEVCGPYPFRNEKYGVVETPFLGMEHQTAIAYGNGYRKFQFDYDWLHHHELSHEWWGNLVTCSDWKDMWIHEGIGTYTQSLWIERTHGAEGYQASIRGLARQIANRRPIAPRETTDSQEIYFGKTGSVPDNDIYNKGALAMHTLRWLLGDETFFAALRRMAYPDPALEKVTDGSQCRHEDTEGIRAIAEKVSGRDLSWFFEVYLRHGALPELIEKRDGAKLELSWKAPGVEVFPMPVEVEIDGERRRVEMPEGRTTVELPSADADVTVDPDYWLILRR